MAGSCASPGSGVLADAAVAARVDDGRAPALRRLLVAGLVVELRVQPADDVGRPAQPQRVVLVLGELQVVGHVARVDVHELLRFHVPVRELALAARDREVPGGRMIGALPAPGGVVRRPDPLRDPQAPLGVQHRVVSAVAACRGALVAPVGRRDQRRRAGVGIAPLRHRIACRHVEPHRLVRDRVRDREAGAADAVDGGVRIEVGIPLVGGDLVVHHRDRVAPAPHRHDDVALHPLRPRRGSGGTSPAAMRSVQSAKSCSARSRPIRLRPLFMLGPLRPTWTR